MQNVNTVMKEALGTHIARLEELLQADVLTIASPILHGLDQLVRIAVEGLAENRRPALAVVLDTGGGVIEVVERMVHTLRHHYDDITFVVPDRALSAGTVFAMSGDRILMDYYSVLGPIDPQIETGDNKLVPALGYLAQYEKLIEKAQQHQLTTPELVLLQKLDLAELQQYHEARELSVDLLKSWLARYKFKDWHTTETRRLPVDDAKRRHRAEEIARALSDPQRWHSHGRGISMSVLSSELNLRIDAFESIQGFSLAMKTYFGCLTDFTRQKGFSTFVHARNYF